MESSLSATNAAVAQFLRSKAFRLQVDALDEAAFFKVGQGRAFEPLLPDVSIPPTLLNSRSRPTGPGLLTESERSFFGHNGDVWISDDALGEFSAALLDIFGYRKGERVVERGKQFVFTVPVLGTQQGAQITIDIAAALQNGQDEFVLLILNASGKNPSRGIDYEPALVAAALAAWRHNNAVRTHTGKAHLSFKDFACIAMIGTAPVFYRVLIDHQVADNIARPGQSLIVKKLVPPVPDQGRYMVDGMVPLENRRIVFRCLDQFRKFVSDGPSSTYPHQEMFDRNNPFGGFMYDEQHEPDDVGDQWADYLLDDFETEDDGVAIP